MGVTAPGARRVGLFGGAFDPPHNAHVALARIALQQLRLDELRILPTGQAWHKTRTLSPAADRLAMARLAFGDLTGTVIDEREISRTGPTFTVDTLEELKAEMPEASLHLIIGGDQARALTRWHRWQDILRLAIISVAERAEATPTFPKNSPETALPAEVQSQLERLAVPSMAVSATEIRSRVARGLGIDHLVPAAVARYIDQHHLYLTA